MHAIGFDIGTSSISAVVVDAASGMLVHSSCIQNASAMKDAREFESLQDPSAIFRATKSLLDALLDQYGEVVSIGLTGQMHGVVYVDSQGLAVSPLYNWQDQRGELCEANGSTYVKNLAGLSGYQSLATGFGAVTHYYHCRNESVPPNAASFCTIPCYVGMRLCGNPRPLLHASDAAAVGLFQLETGRFDVDAIRRSGLDEQLFPAVSNRDYALSGAYRDIPVSIGIGDNQASFLGSVRNMSDSILVNVGTGGQISCLSAGVAPAPGIEVRPCLEGAYLLVGSTLCSGYSYALLEGFFSQVVEMATGKKPGKLYDKMDELAVRHADDCSKLNFETTFSGTRQDSGLRARISQLGTGNFRPEYFINGVLDGIAEELYQLYAGMQYAEKARVTKMVCAGNGVRRNKPLQTVLTRKFNLPLFIPAHEEEAAYGCALYAMVAVGHFAGIAEAQAMIRYKTQGTP